jgi:endoglucanase
MLKQSLFGLLVICAVPTLVVSQERPIDKGHDLPRLRGAMVYPKIDEAGLQVLGQQWNANLIRWGLFRTAPVDNPLDLVAYQQWLQSELKRLDAALPLCEKYGLLVVVDLHSPPGGHLNIAGYAGSDHGLFTDAACQRKFVEVWQEMARKYKGVKAIWAYDLANEPVEPPAAERLAGWQDLAERAARAIRAIDPQRTIIVEPAQGNVPEAFKELRPLTVSNVVYSPHMYLPFEFTHQGVFGRPTGYRYPGDIGGKMWGKAELEAALQPAIDFQRKYGVRMYVGEFSAIRWAPDGSACRYLKDLIDIFEAHGWDWTYHSFREWDGWSAEHGSDRNDHQRSRTPTDREQLLRAWFAKNVKAEKTGEHRN